MGRIALEIKSHRPPWKKFTASNQAVHNQTCTAEDRHRLDTHRMRELNIMKHEESHFITHHHSHVLNKKYSSVAEW